MQPDNSNSPAFGEPAANAAVAILAEFEIECEWNETVAQIPLGIRPIDYFSAADVVHVSRH
jgi:hypothetical protein